MNDSVQEISSLKERFAEVFTQLHEQDIEQFYAHYQFWILRHRLPVLEERIATLHRQLAENQHLIDVLQPPTIALTVLARLRSLGVNEVDLLDRLLDRGEDWLDLMMQRLDYCEQVEDFIQGDYAQWCINSLDGAYDWIDSLRGSLEEETKVSATEPSSYAEDIQATEEFLRQKFSIEDEDAMREATIKLPAITFAQLTGIEELAEEVAEQDLAANGTALVQSEDMPVALDQMAVENVPAADQAEIPTAQAELVFPEQAEREEEAAQEQPFDLDESGSMDAWLTVLQQDTLARIEAGETEIAEYSVPEIVLPGLREEHPLSASSPEGALLDLPEISGADELVVAQVPYEDEVADNSQPLSEAESGENTQITTKIERIDLAAEREDQPVAEVVASEVVLTEQEAEEPVAEVFASEVVLAEPEQAIDASEQRLLELEIALTEYSGSAEALEQLPPVPETVAQIETEAPVSISSSDQAPEDQADASSPGLLIQQPSVDSELESSFSETSVSEQIPASTVENELARELEEASIANAVLLSEDGQLPWYEYLGGEEEVRVATQDQSELSAHSELGSRGDQEELAQRELEISQQPTRQVAAAPDSIAAVIFAETTPARELEISQQPTQQVAAAPDSIAAVIFAETAPAEEEVAEDKKPLEISALTPAQALPTAQFSEDKFTPITPMDSAVAVPPQQVFSPAPLAAVSPGVAKRPGFWRRLFRRRDRV
jgi:hypothetical protein